MATIKDVAREAGLTVTTVSRVLNNRGYISDAAREKVNAAMEKLDYRPNEVARSLSKSKSNTIGLIVPHIIHPYFAKLISNIENEAGKIGYRIMLCNTKENTEKELEYLEMCRSNRVAGIVLCSPAVDAKKFEDLRIPLITIECSSERGDASIECDNFRGGELAAVHLADRGCKKILYFSGIVDMEMPADDREKGFTSMCEKLGIEYRVKKTEADLYYTMEYKEFIKKSVQEEENIDGIFASSDLIAAQVIQVLTKLNISIPKQMQLVGFDDVNISELTTPQITTVHQPIKEMAELAVRHIKDYNGKKALPKRTVFPVTLIKRETTR